MKKNIVLINPPSPFLENPKVEPYLGILYIAATLERRGMDVRVEDLSGKEDYLGRVGDLRGDIFGVTSVTPQYPYARNIAERLRRANPQALLVLGGAHPTTLHRESLEETEYDVMVRGEGEETFAEIAQGDTPMQRVRGITYRDNKGVTRVNPDRAQIPNLDGIPFPARHLIDMGEYERRVAGGLATTLITSRGCPFTCAYCDSEVWGRKVRFRSAQNVLEEIDQIGADYGIHNLLFIDDTFTLKNSRLEEICSGLRERSVDWRCWTRVDQVNQETLDMMAESGCREISFGIESGSQEILDLMRKGTTIEQNRQAIEMAKNAGIKSKAFLMIGFPGETLETIDATKRFVETASPDDWILSTFVPIVGSEIWRSPEKFGILEMSKDYGAYWEVGRGGRGGMEIETEHLSAQELYRAREELLGFLRERIPK